MRPVLGLLAWMALLATAQAAPDLVKNGGFEGGAEAVRQAGWSLDSLCHLEQGPAAEGQACLRLTGTSGGAQQKVSLKPNTGYVARCRIRLTGGGAHLTFGLLSKGAIVMCRDIYCGAYDAWSELVLPFRTTADTDLSLYCGKRYGQADVRYDAVRVVEDDNVQVGDVSPRPHPFPQTTAAEQARGYLVSSPSWMELIYPSYYPLRSQVARELTCRLAPGEFEPVTLCVTGLRDLQEVAVTLPADLKSPTGRKLPGANLELRTTRTITRWLTAAAPLQPGQRFERRPLFLFPYEPAAVPARETHEFWLTVHAPATAAPGVYSGTVVVSAREAPTLSLPLRVEVLPLRLAQPDVTYGMYYRHGQQYPPLKTEGFFRQVLRDMRDHGMNSMSVYADVERKQGDGYAVDFDYAPQNYGLNQQLRELQAAGLAKPGHPLLLLASGKYDGAFWGEDKTIAALQARQREQGWPEFLLYLVDEPSGARIELAKQLNTIAHRVPGLRTTSALGVPGELADSYDVWIISNSVLTLPQIIQQAQAKHKAAWTYDCVANGCQPRNDRYFAGLHTWSAGLTGNWQWCYTEKSGWVNERGEIELINVAYEDPWYATYLISSPGGAIPTLGWEARREGVDDYRYIQTLREAIAAARQSGSPRQRALAAEAEAYLAATRQRVRRPVPKPADVSAVYAEACYDRLKHPGLQPEDYDAIRRQVADYIIGLQGQ